MERNFCYLCGAKLETIAGEQVSWRCSSCGQVFYNNPRPSASAVIVNDKQEVLLATRDIEPHKGRQDLPGGFVEVGETYEAAIIRELTEELGLHVDDYEPPEYLASMPDIYPWKREDLPTLVVGFLIRLKSGITPQAHDDVASVVFTPLGSLTQADIAWKADFTFIDIVQQRTKRT